MTIDSYQDHAYQAIQEHESRKDEMLNWAVGLSEECGEVLGLIKHEMWAKEQPSKEEYAKEMGDVLWYLSALAVTLDIDLNTVALLNLYKLEKRHGKEFSVEGSHERHSLEEQLKEDDYYKELIEGLQLEDK